MQIFTCAIAYLISATVQKITLLHLLEDWAMHNMSSQLSCVFPVYLFFQNDYSKLQPNYNPNYNPNSEQVGTLSKL